MAVGPRHAAAGRVAVSVGLVRCGGGEAWEPGSTRAGGATRHPAALGGGRVLEAGIDAVWETQAGRGRKPQYDLSQRDALIAATLQTKPKGMTHWSCQLMAKAQGVSKNTVNRLWQLHNLKPHLSRTFKLSRDSKFVEKLTDVVGLYLNPPQKALVLCVDEKSQIQALDRTQPRLPLKKGRCGTTTHDYKSHGTTTLFAALSLLDGKVIGQCQARHRHQEFLKFLRRLDREFPREQQLHLVLDNYGTHKTPQVQAWLRTHRRFVPHFIPTSSSWLNPAERWFGELTEKAIRRSAFVSVPELVQAIETFLAAWMPTRSRLSGRPSWRTSSVRSSGLGPNWSPSSLFARSPNTKNWKSDMSSYLRDTTLVHLKVRNARGVKVPFRENAFRPVIDRNCDTVRWGGEQREVKS